MAETERRPYEPWEEVEGEDEGEEMAVTLSQAAFVIGESEAGVRRMVDDGRLPGTSDDGTTFLVGVLELEERLREEWEAVAVYYHAIGMHAAEKAILDRDAVSYVDMRLRQHQQLKERGQAERAGRGG
jgi:hypothetical protein